MIFSKWSINEEIYMSRSKGFDQENRHYVCKLHKAIYGLKQAPIPWFDTLAYTLLKFSIKC